MSGDDIDPRLVGAVRLGPAKIARLRAAIAELHSALGRELSVEQVTVDHLDGALRMVGATVLLTWDDRDQAPPAPVQIDVGRIRRAIEAARREIDRQQVGAHRPISLGADADLTALVLAILVAGDEAPPAPGGAA